MCGQVCILSIYNHCAALATLPYQGLKLTPTMQPKCKNESGTVFWVSKTHSNSRWKRDMHFAYQATRDPEKGRLSPRMQIAGATVVDL
jgi:hypothetical protein